GATNKKRKLVAGALVMVLLAMLVATSHPQKDLMDRMGEGIAPEMLSSAYYCGLYADGLVASDHPASSIIFGFTGTNATWDTAQDTLVADTFEEAAEEMREVNSPSGKKRVDFVAIDKSLESGVMLFPWDPASKPSEEAIDKFNHAPYMKLYDNGYSRLYYVNWGLAED
ncbi:MAG: hypothetical protein KAW09_03420, partial [Thermoplasmata archaeon]|nr:hypothetical protein [Thermoplasmata archaeon]